MQFIKVVLIFLGICLIIDVVLFFLLQRHLHLNTRQQSIYVLGYWFLSALFFGLSIYTLLTNRSADDYMLKNAHYPMSGAFVLLYLPKILLLVWTILFGTIGLIIHKINGSTFLPYHNAWLYSGFTIAAIVFLFVADGIVFGKFRYQIKHVDIVSSKVDAPIKVVQYTDFHIGSFRNNEKQIKKIVQLINNVDADIVVFTGDLVNTLAAEAEPFAPLLQQVKSKYGVFGVMGNHDYGEYYPWPSQEAYLKNKKAVKEVYISSGMSLLNNENVMIKTSQGASIQLVGVENWGLPPFPQYGNLELAMEGLDDNHFTLLLSHDPTHWEETVQNKPEVDLTLSGHTHGMQFGICIGKFRWSPVSFKYKKWYGLYQGSFNKLFVSKGIGYIGFPGRVGMWPEIVVLNIIPENGSEAVQ